MTDSKDLMQRALRLLGRARAVLEEKDGDLVNRSVEHDPLILVTEAEDLFEDVAMRLGLVTPPRTVSMPMPSGAPVKGLPHQDRAWFDAGLVLEFLKRCPHHGEAPQQGWLSLVREACHRVAILEGTNAALEILVEKRTLTPTSAATGTMDEFARTVGLMLDLFVRLGLMKDVLADALRFEADRLDAEDEAEAAP